MSDPSPLGIGQVLKGSLFSELMRGENHLRQLGAFYNHPV